jgi:hypothetical protein
MRATASMLGLFLLTGCGATTTLAPAPAILPLTTVRLYETGMGYFERSGTLNASARTSLPVPASHLDDALESLVVLTGGKSERLRGIEFGSNLSRGMARAMAGLPTGADAPITYRDLLTSLRGAHVEVTTRTEVFVGRLVDIDASLDRDPAATPTGDTTEKNGTPPLAPPPLRLVVLTDASALVRIAAPDVTSVRPTDAAYAARLDAALDALSAHSAQSRKMLDLLGATNGPVTLAYVAEAPVWRTSYRFVLDDAGKGGTLQAWALVHNDTDEDWQSVKIELVNGRPDSFLFPMAAPRYARRPLVHPDDQLSTVPQLLDKTADAIWGDNIDDVNGAGGLGLTGYGEGGGGGASGFGYASITTLGHGSRTSSSNLLTVGDLASIGQATGTEAGALFVYAVPDRLALRAHGSALLPFLQQPVEAEPIAWIETIGEPARSALRFVNSTSQTLPAGTVTVFGSGGFAGESALDRLKPGERRFIRYGVDLDIDAKTVSSKVSDATERLTFDAGTLTEHFLRTTDSTYAIESRSGHPRAVYVAMHIDHNAKLTGADAVDYDAATSTPLAILRVAGGKRVERAIVSIEGLSRRVAASSLSVENLTNIVASSTLAAADKIVATEALARQRELEETRKAQKQASLDLAAVEKELARLREDTKALGGERGAAPPAEFVKRLLAAEDRHAAVRKQLEGLEAEEKKRVENVVTALSKLRT